MSNLASAKDAEVAVLGAAMSGYRDIDDLLEMLEPSDFYSPFHEEVWAAIGRVHGAGNQPDPISVRLALDSAAVKHDPIRLFDMAQLAPVIAQAPYYAQQVIAAAGRRRLQQAGTVIHELGSNESSDLEILREEARAAVDDATRGRAVTAARTLAEILPSVLDVAENGRAKALETGWDDLDRMIGGLAPGRLVIVGARPGVGKSLMGTNLAVHFAHRHQHAVLFASLEMDAEEVLQRMLARHARVNLTALMDGKTTEAEWNRIAPRSTELNEMPIRVLDAPNQTVTSIRREARNFQRVRDDLALIVVDYLQLMQTSGRGTNRSEQLGEISRGLKLLARETGACVVAMAQVNREGTRHADGRPRMADLRESGSIEADADVVILLHQPDDQLPELEVIVDKNRHGPKGIATLEVQGHYAHLASRAWSPSGGAA
ncbi:replicative DNA helicase [Nocardioides kribbensis]|uniref:replicative DNA helicase n=1 Tax=Nocardioides kribbensis TaxID=305517 RepID=UPI00187A4617|nr:DnaB-like helicase C-terminal domain-containing protein [Nocardioides kribbensis]